jgi:transposase InsO family protein
MKENQLLQERHKRPSEFDKNIIKSKPRPIRPLEILEIDIKYIFIDGLDKNGYLMTILDTFTRQVYEWSLELTMKTTDIKNLIEKFIDNHLIKFNIKTKNLSISFRTDNGTQFTSKMYQRIRKTFEFTSTYIPSATPKLNGHIESYHSIVEELVCKKLNEAKFKELKRLLMNAESKIEMRNKMCMP